MLAVGGVRIFGVWGQGRPGLFRVLGFVFWGVGACVWERERVRFWEG